MTFWLAIIGDIIELAFLALAVWFIYSQSDILAMCMAVLKQQQGIIERLQQSNKNLVGVCEGLLGHPPTATPTTDSTKSDSREDVKL